MTVQHPHLKTRRFRVFKDQHGLKWSCTVDTTTNDPIDNLRPHQRKVPWLPPHDVVKLVHNEEDGTSAVRIDYGALKANLRLAHKLWNERLLKIGYARGGDDFRADDPSPAVLHEVGPRPHPIEPAIAAERGDPWILGLSPTMPAWAKPFFVKALPDEAAFMQAAEDRVSQLDAAAKYEDIEDAVDPLPPTPPAPKARQRRRGRPRKVARTHSPVAAAVAA